MKPSSRALLAVCCVAAALVGTLLLVPAREPGAKGHCLSYWLVAYRTNWSELGLSAKNEAWDSVQQIGTNAIPCLLKWVRYEEPAWRGKLYLRLMRLPRKQQRPWIIKAARPLVPCRPERPDAMARTGFEILGSKAEAALPQLVSLASDVRATNTAQRAIFCLTKIGPAGFSYLLTTLTNSTSSGWLRASMARQLCYMESHPSTGAVVSALNVAAKDPDPLLHKAAADSLAHMVALNR